MSASRKKKERREAEEPVISSRAQEEQEKAAKRKRNTIIYSIIGVVVVILAAILLIWDSGIIQRNAKVAEIGGEKVTGSQVAYYYYNHPIIYYSQLYSYYGMAPTYDPSASPKEQIITADAVAEYNYYGLTEEYVGLTYHDFFLNYALDSLRQEQALLDAADKAGYKLSDEGRQSVDSTMEELDTTLASYLSSYGADLSRTAYLQMTYGSSMNESKYRACVENATLADEFYNSHLDAFADYSEEELDAYYQEHRDAMDTVHFYYRQFDGMAESTTDEEGNTVEPTEEEEAAALAKAEEDANAALAEVEGNLAAVEGSEDYTEQQGVLSPGSFYYDWLMDSERQPGDATILDGTTGTSFYVVVFAERFRDETPTVNVRHILVEAANEDDPATEDVDESTQEPTEEVFAAAKETAQGLLEEWKAGEATEESFAALAEEHSADPGSNTNGGLYENVTEGQMIANFNDWIFDPARQSGDVSEPIQNTESSTTKGWHIIYFAGQDEPAWKLTARSEKWSSDLKDSVEIVRTDRLDSMFS